MPEKKEIVTLEFLLEEYRFQEERYESNLEHLERLQREVDLVKTSNREIVAIMQELAYEIKKIKEKQEETKHA